MILLQGLHKLQSLTKANALGRLSGL